MRELILKALQEERHVSGEQLGKRIHISRTAVWKHINALRKKGYQIHSSPRLGYTFVKSADLLLAEEIGIGLETRIIGKRIVHCDEITSTQDVAEELARSGAEQGTVVIAETQTKGRGRKGRNWVSSPEGGIYLSIILRPNLMPSQIVQIPLIAGVAVSKAIKNLTSLEPRIKWPNDMLIHNKKIGGILTELSAEMDVTRFVLIGFGLNVNNDKKALLEGTTSLREQKKEEVDRAILLQEILRRIEANYLFLQAKGSSVIIDKWRNYGITLGRRVKVSCQSQHLEGEAIDIDTDGGLLLRLDSGFNQKVMAGDVVHCR